MADFDNTYIASCEAMLKIEENDNQTFLENKQNMLKTEWTRFSNDQHLPSTTSKIILDILQTLINDSQEYGQCHKSTFGKIGGAGFGKSYSKKC